MTQHSTPDHSTPEQDSSDSASLRVVGIGASAGGIEALQRFFEGLPSGRDATSRPDAASGQNAALDANGASDANRASDSNRVSDSNRALDAHTAFVVVMHLAPDHTSELAPVLQNYTTMPVQQVAEPTEVKAGRVYVVAPGKALDMGTAPDMEGAALIPTEFEDLDARRTPIDHFFRSLAEAPVDAVGLVLSGSGSDGALGLRAIEAGCGLTGVQDPDEATHASMPQAAIKLMQGPDFILPAAELAQRISTQNKRPALLDEVRSPGKARSPDGAASNAERNPERNTEHDATERDAGSDGRDAESNAAQPQGESNQAGPNQERPNQGKLDQRGPNQGKLIQDTLDTDALDTGALDGLGAERHETLRKIFVHVRSRTGQDFSQYKLPTMLRRIERRMHVHQQPTMSEYLSLLQEQPAEAQKLKQEFLISVSNFFRNPASFAALQEQVITPLVAGKGEGEPIRVWVPGCATGEEAYSLAILLLEACAQHATRPDRIQIFASDLDRSALAQARKGRYPESIASDVPKRHLETYFRREDAWYTTCEAVRERIIFTPHDLLRDPPFSKLDLVSCRNLLIYLRRGLQESVFKLLNYALNDSGYLFLGSSESADETRGLFRVVDKAHCIYQSSRNTGLTVPELPTAPLTMQASDRAEVERRGPTSRPPGRSSAKTLHRQMLEAYAPPSALVDESHSIVRLSAGAGRYLEHPAGTPSSNILEIVRTELQIKLQAALREAFSAGTSSRTAPVQVKMNGITEQVRLLVHPAQEPAAETTGSEAAGSEAAGSEATGSEATGSEAAAPVALVMFVSEGKEPALPPQAQKLTTDGPAIDGPAIDGDEHSDEGSNTGDLRRELQQTKRQLHNTIEDHEISKQEMRAANEELRSMNEEYKSMTEELETSKEELQSVNEELKTVNEELKAKVEELRQANNDLKNLIAATNIGTLFVDSDLKIERFTPPVEKLFNIEDGDVGRSIGAFTNCLDYEDLEADARDVLATDDPVEREVESTRHESTKREGTRNEWFSVRIRPYRTVEDKIEGVVFTFVDITERKHAELELRASSDRLRKRTEQVRSLSTALTLAEEHERKRLGQILHDDLQQQLFAVQIRVENLQEKLQKSLEKNSEESLKKNLKESGPSADGDPLERIASQIRKSIGITRSLSAELNPPVGKESLYDALEWLAVHMNTSYDLNVVLRAEASCPQLDPDVHLLLFRTVRELLFNVVKHAGVEQARVVLACEPGESVRITVSDEGAGFDSSALVEDASGKGASGKGGVGLFSIKERLEMIGGWFTVDTAPGEGTRTTIGVPIDTDPDIDSDTDLDTNMTS